MGVFTKMEKLLSVIHILRDANSSQDARKMHPFLLGLYESCRSSRDRYQEMGMPAEAGVFAAYMKQIESAFALSSPKETTDSPGASV